MDLDETKTSKSSRKRLNNKMSLYHLMIHGGPTFSDEEFEEELDQPIILTEKKKKKKRARRRRSAKAAAWCPNEMEKPQSLEEQAKEDPQVLDSKEPETTLPTVHERTPMEPEPTARMEPESTTHMEPEPTSHQEPEDAPDVIVEEVFYVFTAAAEQQAACPVQKPSVEAYCDFTNQSLVQIPEYELHRITGEKEEQISRLVQEKETLLQKADHLEQLLEREREEGDFQQQFLLTEISKQEEFGREASQKMGQLQKDLEAEKELRQKMDVTLAKSKEEFTDINTALAQTREDLQHQKHQWEQDRSLLLTKHQDATATLMAALNKAKEDLDNERRQWEEEKSSLLESLKTIKETPEEKEELSSGPMDRLSDLERQIDHIEVQEAQKKKKPKKSMWRRFLHFFK